MCATGTEYLSEFADGSFMSKKMEYHDTQGKLIDTLNFPKCVLVNLRKVNRKYKNKLFLTIF